MTSYEQVIKFESGGPAGVVRLVNANGYAAVTTENPLGTCNWVWNAQADLPSGWQSERVKINGCSKDVTTYIVKFNANGGSGTMSNQTMYIDEVSALNANAEKDM